MWKPKVAFVGLCAFLTGALAVDRCEEKYLGNVCAGYVNYTYFLAGNSTSDSVEADLTRLTEISRLFGKTAPSCVDDYYRWACGRYFPQCRGHIIYYGCRSSCDTAVSECSRLLSDAGHQDWVPDCSEVIRPFNVPYQTDAKYCLDVGSNANAQRNQVVPVTCPAPLVQDPTSGTDSGGLSGQRWCSNGCCLPCPMTHLMFKEGEADSAETATLAIGIVCSLLAALCVFVYSILPQKRQFPGIVVLWLALATALFQGVYFFVARSPRDVQCASDGVTSAKMQNNGLCAVQGIVLVFAALAAVFWNAFLILNFHLQTVWNSLFFDRHFRPVQLMCWGVPAVLTAITAGQGAINHSFGALCRVTPESAYSLFLYPLSVVLFPAILVHLSTTAHVIRRYLSQTRRSGRLTAEEWQSFPVATRSSPQRIPWRPILFPFAFLALFTQYWAFWFAQFARLNNRSQAVGETFRQWFACLQQANGQNQCADLVKDIVLSPSAYAISEIFVAFSGFCLFTIFLCSRGLLGEVKSRFTKTQPTQTVGRIKKYRDSSDALTQAAKEEEITRHYLAY